MKVSIFALSQSKGIQHYESLADLASIGTDSRIWVDVESDDPAELAPLAAHFGLHELSIEDCLTPNHFPKIEDYGHYTFIIVRALKAWGEVETIWESLSEGRKPPERVERVSYSSKSKEIREEEEKLTRKIALYLSDRFVVTFRRHEISWLDALVRQISQEPERYLSSGTDTLAHRVLDVLIDRFIRGMNFFENVIESMEDDAFHTAQFSMSPVLELKQALVFIRQIVRDQGVVTTKLASDTAVPVRKHQRRYFRDIDDHLRTLADVVDKQIDAINGVRDAYFASANVRLNDTMRVLAVITTVAAVLNILVGLYGMNFEYMPLLSHAHGFWFMVGLIAASSLVMVAFFKAKRWL